MFRSPRLMLVVFCLSLLAFDTVAEMRDNSRPRVDAAAEEAKQPEAEAQESRAIALVNHPILLSPCLIEALGGERGNAPKKEDAEPRRRDAQEREKPDCRNKPAQTRS